MSKQQEFGLDFIKWVSPRTNTIYNICERKIVDQYSELQILSRFDERSAHYLIAEITQAENNEPYNPLPSSDSWEDVLIEIDYPNITIDEVLTISVSDFKSLLQEWLVFISE